MNKALLVVALAAALAAAAAYGQIPLPRGSNAEFVAGSFRTVHATGGSTLDASNVHTCYQIDGVCAGTNTYDARTGNITAGLWKACVGGTFITAGQTITLAAASTMSTNGCYELKVAQGITVSIAPTGANTINGANATLLIAGPLTTLITTNGSNAFTIPVGPPIPLALTYAPGINPNNLPIANILQPRVILGIRCTPEVAAGGTATISVVKAASGTALSAGTVLHSGSCNANGTAATDQDLTPISTPLTLAAGDRLGIKTTGTTIWTSSGIAAGVVTVFVR